MITTLEEKKRRLAREIEVAKFQLENNIENIDVSDYLFNQFNIKNKIGDFLSFSKIQNTGLVTNLLFKDGSLFSKIISMLKHLIGLNSIK